MEQELREFLAGGEGTFIWEGLPRAEWVRGYLVWSPFPRQEEEYQREARWALETAGWRPWVYLYRAGGVGAALKEELWSLGFPGRLTAPSKSLYPYIPVNYVTVLEKRTTERQEMIPLPLGEAGREYEVLLHPYDVRASRVFLSGFSCLIWELLSEPIVDVERKARELEALRERVDQVLLKLQDTAWDRGLGRAWQAAWDEVFPRRKFLKARELLEKLLDEDLLGELLCAPPSP